MAPAISRFFRDTTFDPFLFAAVGEELNGMSLSVLSALARLELDPWCEAASLSRLPATAATVRLTSLLSSLPKSQLKAPAPAAIMRLVELLPKAAPEQAWSRGAPAATKSKNSWSMVVFFVLAFVMICAAQLAERRASKSPTGYGASPAASTPEPGAAKARDE